MKNVVQSRLGWLLGLVVVLSAARLAFAQIAAPAPAPHAAIMEFTQQEVQPALMVQTLNDLGKQKWEIFQVVPVWTINNQNGATELAPRSYQVFGRRPLAEAK